jgi:hypothetical protein
VLDVEDEEAVVVCLFGLDADGEAAGAGVGFGAGADGGVDFDDGCVGGCVGEVLERLLVSWFLFYLEMF